MQAHRHPDNPDLIRHIVLYRENTPLSYLCRPSAFQCWAEDAVHAEEQCGNAYPNHLIVWIYMCTEESDDIETALSDYYTFAQ